MGILQKLPSLAKLNVNSQKHLSVILLTYINKIMSYSEIDLIKIIRIATQKYYYNHFNDCNIKNTWSCINSTMKHNKVNCLPSHLLVGNKNNPETICECFNSYFIDIGRNLSKDINCSKNQLAYVDSNHKTSLFSAQHTNTKS